MKPTTKMSRLQSLSHSILVDNGPAGGVHQPGSLLHLGDEFLVEESLGLLVEGAVDGDDIALGDHLLEALHATAADLLLGLLRQGIVVEVEEFLAVEGLQTAEDTLSNPADGYRSDDFSLQVELVLGHGGHIPLSLADLEIIITRITSCD